MNKKIFLLILSIVLLTAGCTNNKEEITKYNTVDEYELAMSLKQKEYPAFKFIANRYKNNGKKQIAIGYKEDNKWIDEIKMPVGRTYFYYDGNKTYINNIGKRDQVNWPKEITLQYLLTKWIPTQNTQGVSKSFTNESAEVNKIPCRMINYRYSNGNNIDVCVSDKYGVAVYYSFSGHRIINGKVVDKKPHNERIEVVKIESKNLNDSIFK